MKLRPPFLVSDKDTLFQKRRGKWAKHPQRQDGRRAPAPGAETFPGWLCDLGKTQNYSGPQLLRP